MANLRPWFLGAFGAATATTAVIIAAAVIGPNDGATEPQPLGQASNTATQGPTDEPTDSATTSPPSLELGSIPVYYVGETAAGLGLYREFHQAEIRGEDGTLVGSVREAILGDPLDRDYSTLWFGVTDVTVAWNGDVITIDLASDDATGLHEGTGLSAEEQKISLQQVIFSAQGGLGEGRVPVQFLINGDHTDQVLGQPTSEPVSNGSVLATNSHVQLTTPNEGDVITGDTLEVSGVANSFEANVIIRLQRFGGTFIDFNEPVAAADWMGDMLFPFEGSFDISDVAPGRYILAAIEDDPSGGEEGDGPDSDDRVITIK